MSRWWFALVGGIIGLVVAGLLAVTPVSVKPSGLLPDVLRSALPEAAREAEVGCGTVVSPTEPQVDGLLSAVAAVTKLQCTDTVRDRFRLAAGTATLGALGTGVSIVAVRRHSRRLKALRLPDKRRLA